MRPDKRVSPVQITHETVRTITALEVASTQRDYVASNAVSIAEAHFNPGAWFRAINANQTAVGFIMLFDPKAPGAIAKSGIEQTDFGLWRFMIDRKYQRNGYGGEALDLAISYIRETSTAIRLISSFVPGPDGPEYFYSKYGFRSTGNLRVNGKEIEIAFDL